MIIFKNSAILLFLIFLTSCGGGGERVPVILQNEFIPLNYQYDMSFSAYVPNVGTQNIAFSELSQPKLIGEYFPFDFVAVMQFSGAVARFNKAGEIVWMHENGYGRFVSIGDVNLFQNSAQDINEVSILSFNGDIVGRVQFGRDVNFVHQVSDRLAVAFNEPNVPVQIYEWDSVRLEKGRLLLESPPASYSRAVKLDGDFLYVADTFGGKVFIQNIKTGLVEYEIDSYYPNDIDIHDGFMYIAEEHLDRILVIDLSTKRRYVSLAPPGSKVWDPYSWNAMINADELYGVNCILERNGEQLIRSYASDACSGKLTLSAPNGIDVIDRGVLVADTDNARVIYAGMDGAISVLIGLNNPTKLFFLK